MTATRTPTWAELNLSHLTAALRRVRSLLAPDSTSESTTDADELAARMVRPPALVTLTTAFGLSPFERDLLLAAAGLELDAGLAAGLTGTDRSAESAADEVPALSFGRALAQLPEPHWSALAPSAPLRRWRLLELEADGPVTRVGLRAAERVLHFLLGVQTLDPEIECVVTLPEPGPTLPELAPGHALLAERAVRAVTSAAPLGHIPLVQLVGPTADGRDIAAATADALGFTPAIWAATDIPSGAREQERLARLWEREAVLSGLLLVLDAGGLGEDPHAAAALTRFADLLASPTFLLTPTPLHTPTAAPGLRDEVHLSIPPVPVPERLALWHGVLPDPDPALGVDRIAAHFVLSRRDIGAVLGELALTEPADTAESGRLLWRLCRERSSPRLAHLAQRLAPASAWEQLVLPEQQRDLLSRIANQARLRHRVHTEWGFAERGRRGLGLSVLFAGPSGTGKTMAAEALAEVLELDLYRIDLSRVVSKYIGETERNLGRIFDEAEGAGGAILLFDEADALFGKRTEVRDSHDRYANLEVSYLLQRMEEYQGLAILTTNLKSSLDQAFLRRLRFVVTFPFPDQAGRTRIWEGAFPPATPTRDLRYDRLARLTVTGGNIRTIALNAAFAAAGAGEPVTMAHILGAARQEYAKLERPLTDAETRGWL